ncbi:MAG: ABC transporter substrate-binding protein [Chloroflexota bacterium]|nr:ABC transporter substrate-binding protein [Chloroflexota bacterium]
MKKGDRFDRREFLRYATIAAGGAVVSACGSKSGATTPQATVGSAARTSVATSVAALPEPTVTVGANTGHATPAQASTKAYKESPQLAALVKAGKLPALQERLPKNPYVVPHKWVKPGKYGGQMRMACNSDWGVSHFFMYIHMYGNQLLRLLKDGQEIGPGLVEEWAPNQDLSKWTLRFREGLKWSDGQPLTTADFMYWWEDMVLNEEHPAVIPDVARSGKNTPAKITATDDLTIVMTFDAPAPLTDIRLAMGSGGYIQPKHYMQQFHPKYNPKLKSKKDWMTEHDAKADYSMNPDCPTMTGWKLRSFKESQSTVWERNPYYWCVTREGDQLPYVDTVSWTNFQSLEPLKLAIQQGKFDYIHGSIIPLALTDIAELKQAQQRAGFDLLLWDSGSGTASMFFLNYDIADPKLRKIFREPNFRKAISHAFNREEARKVIYFNSGEATTGTFSPKAKEYLVNDEGKQVYASWRDSALKYDPERAKKLLDDLGVVDKNGDGIRELPDGTKLTILLNYPAPGSPEHISKDNLLAKDLKAVGLNAQLGPVPSTSENDQWHVGKLMSKTAWEVGDGPDHLSGPWWLLPIEPDRWAPLHGQMYSLRGTPDYKTEKHLDPYKRHPPRVDPEPGGPIDRLYKLYDRAKLEPDPMKRYRLVWDMIKIHVSDGPFFMGVVANYPQIVLRRQGLQNVPRREDLALGGMVNTWAHPTPAVYDPEAYFWESPEKQS